jgi:alkanesulfonate monooxygenase SsuD/methylene tetrahydromethanopterin reductase-like flavin-dependent oxidoreductase (luciferase family)
MEVGVVLDGRRPAAEVAELAQLAESCGLAHVWLGGGARTKDHFVRLAVAAAATRRIRIGPIAVSPFEMHPAQIGLALLTLDEASHGRAGMVLGAGGDLAATLAPPRTGRVEAVSECIDIVRALAAGGEVAYTGRHYRVDGLFSPWPAGVRMDRLYLGANRPRMLALAARKADGVMLTDMPLAYVGTLIDRLRGELRAAGRERAPFAISNWLVWNVQDSREAAIRLARRQLGFRLYYIREIAASIGLDDAQARELAARQPEMIRSVFRGTTAWSPAPAVVDTLIDHLTLTADRRGLDGCIARILEFERRGLTEIALAPHGDPAAAIRLIGAAVIPSVQRAAGQHESR